MKKIGMLAALTVIMMTVGVGTAFAEDLLRSIQVPEPVSIVMVVAGILGIAGITMRKK